MTTALLLVHLGIVIAFTLRILLRHDLTPPNPPGLVRSAHTPPRY